MASHYPRRRILVDPGFQFRLLFRVGLYFFTYAIVVIHVSFLCEVLQALLTERALKCNTAFYFQFLNEHRFFLIGVIALSPPLLYDLLKFSNRVAGPLFRCRKTMLEMAKGKPVPEFKPRQHDLMPELFQALNTLIKEHNGQITAKAANQPANGDRRNFSADDTEEASPAELQASV